MEGLKTNTKQEAQGITKRFSFLYEEGPSWQSCKEKTPIPKRLSSLYFQFAQDCKCKFKLGQNHLWNEFWRASLGGNLARHENLPHHQAHPCVPIWVLGRPLAKQVVCLVKLTSWGWGSLPPFKSYYLAGLQRSSVSMESPWEICWVSFLEQLCRLVVLPFTFLSVHLPQDSCWCVFFFPVDAASLQGLNFIPTLEHNFLKSAWTWADLKEEPLQLLSVLMLGDPWCVVTASIAKALAMSRLEKAPASRTWFTVGNTGKTKSTSFSRTFFFLEDRNFVFQNCLPRAGKTISAKEGLENALSVIQLLGCAKLECRFLGHANIYIYIYICCGVIIWAKFGLLRCYYLGQVCFLQNTVCQKTL